VLSLRSFVMAVVVVVVDVGGVEVVTGVGMFAVNDMIAL
jgi:hypothetical protein